MTQGQYLLPTAGEALGRSFELYRANFGPLFGAGLLLFFVAQLGVTLPFLGPFCLGMAVLSLDAVRGKEVAFDDYFDAFRDMGASLFVGLWLFGVVLLGCVLASVVFGYGFFVALNAGRVGPMYVGLGVSVIPLVPVCIAIVLYTPAFFLLVDRKMPWRAAMAESSRMVRARWKIWSGLWGTLGLIHLVSTLACVLPSLLVTPWIPLALAVLYEAQARGERTDA